MHKLAIISDSHGCYKTLLELVASIPQDHEIILSGDLVDRGPDPARVVLWAMEHDIRCVMGNHEDLMLFHHGRKSCRYQNRGIWMWNGGAKTVDSFGGDVPAKVLDWAESLPFAIREGDFEISHTGFGGFDNVSRMDRLWARQGLDADLDSLFPPGYYDGIYRVFGHTQRKNPWIEPTFAMIDTGCAYDGYEKLTALLLPEKAIIQQENIE